MSPSLWLALLIVLVGAQVAHLASSRRPVHYVVLLLTSALGFLLAELAVNALHHGGPALGVLHPVADAIGIGVSDGIVIAYTGRRRRAL